ncbi:hypothetical protein [Microbacterium sp. K36]|uniref:hypothetical protein n=1 Tax=Microbacterium sp. K36 TaxID=2305439 RepID=UPI00109D6A32|nr:hypothetical protein [Microbacterium sp. K36]
MSSAHSPSARSRRRRTGWLVAAIAVVVAAVLLTAAAWVLGRRGDLATNVTIALSYVGDDGRTYSCTYDYRTPHHAPMPPEVAAEMNDRDWSQTGQLIYDWAKTHPAESWTTEDELPADDPGSTRADSSWALALDRYITFPPWTIETENGPEYALWWEARQGSNCEDGLR